MGDEIDLSNRDPNSLNSHLGVSVLEFMIFILISRRIKKKIHINTKKMVKGHKQQIPYN